MPIFPLYFSKKSLVKSNAKSAYLNVIQYIGSCVFLTHWTYYTMFPARNGMKFKVLKFSLRLNIHPKHLAYDQSLADLHTDNAPSAANTNCT